MDKTKRDSWKNIYPGEPYPGDQREIARGANYVLDRVQDRLNRATMPKGEYDSYKARKAEREFQRSGSAYKDDSGIIYDREGNQKVQPSLPTKDYLSKDSRARDLYNMQFKESIDLTECGDDMDRETDYMDMDRQEDAFNISTNMSSLGTKNVTVSAEGDKADELLQMLKMAGMRPHDDHDHSRMSKPEIVMIGNDEMMDEEREIEYANTPDEEYETVAAITRQGNDLNREKRQYADKPKLGDNPMAESTFDADLDAMLESILIREREGTPSDIVKAEEPYKDPKTGKMVTPIKGATNPPPDSEFPPGDPRNSMPPKPARKK
jgi:hypothetical protein